jgi:acyl carrier protein
MSAEMTETDSRTVQSRLLALFSEVMHVEVPSAETDLFDSGILDSQRFVELLLHIEQNFQTQISLDDLEIENFRCIEKITTLIVQLKDGGKLAQPSEKS